MVFKVIWNKYQDMFHMQIKCWNLKHRRHKCNECNEVINMHCTYKHTHTHIKPSKLACKQPEHFKIKIRSIIRNNM